MPSPEIHRRNTPAILWSHVSVGRTRVLYFDRTLEDVLGWGFEVKNEEMPRAFWLSFSFQCNPSYLNRTMCQDAPFSRVVFRTVGLIRQRCRRWECLRWLDTEAGFARGCGRSERTRELLCGCCTHVVGKEFLV